MGDKLLFKEEQKPLAKIITEVLLTDYDLEYDPIVVAIGGLSGTGKTEIAHYVKENLRAVGKYAKLLHSDDFYVPDHEGIREESSYSTVGITEIDWYRLKNAVGNWWHIHGYDVIIVEGLYANHVGKDVGFYIDQSYEDSLAFRVARGKENPWCENRIKVLTREKKAVESTREEANYILTYGDNDETITS